MLTTRSVILAGGGCEGNGGRESTDRLFFLRTVHIRFLLICGFDGFSYDSSKKSFLGTRNVISFVRVLA